VLGNLLKSGEQLRVIARDPSQLPAGVRQDLDIVEGSHGDAAVVDARWSGAGEVPLLGPEDLSFNDMAEIMSQVLGKDVR